MKDKQYRVEWEIDVWAQSARGAAIQALKIQRDPDSTATHFKVQEFDKDDDPVDIDLEDGRVDLLPLLEEPDAEIEVTRHELIKLCAAADEALDGNSNDREHDALVDLREKLSEFLENPDRRAK